jgi:glycosyltransferase involved in cell wall biosynthesis
MRIAFATPYDARDVAHWSGIPSFIGRALARQVSASVHYLGPAEAPVRWPTRAKAALIHRVFGRGVWPDLERSVVRRRAAALSARVGDADVVLGVAASHLSQLHCRQPLVLWTDCPVSALVDSYPYATNLSHGTLRNVTRVEQEVFDRAAALVFPSEWAAGIARQTYGAAAEKVHVVPFGANLDAPPTAAEANGAAAARAGRGPCQLLFLGVEWDRKGGDLAAEATRLLNAGGVPARLRVVGCEAPPAVAALPFVDRLGFISKRTAEGRQRLAELFATSHFLLLPTRAEAYGIVFAEASAFGVPSVTTDVGGVGGVVTDGLNGVRLPLAAGADAYADYIGKLWSDPARYVELCGTSRAEFDRRLNWDAAAAALMTILRTLA